MTYAPVILGNKVSFKGPQMILLAIFYFLNSIEIRNFAFSCPVHIRVVPVRAQGYGLIKAIWAQGYTANVLAVKTTFYFCVKNPLTVCSHFSKYLSVVYQDQ